MHKFLSLFAVIVLLGSTGLLSAQAEKGKKDDAVKKERALLKGTWIAEADGKEMKLIIDGTKFTFQMADNTEAHSASGELSLNPKKSPKTMNLTIKKSKSPELKKYLKKTALAIYQLKGDTLKWCASRPGAKDRPKSFKQAEGYLSLQFRRKSSNNN